jgi:hypothetical protein
VGAERTSEVYWSLLVRDAATALTEKYKATKKGKDEKKKITKGGEDVELWERRK